MSNKFLQLADKIESTLVKLLTKINQRCDEHDKKSREVLKNIEVYCSNEKCGEPIPGLSLNPTYSKRRMKFINITILGTAIYMCPVCGKRRKFSSNPLSDGFYEC